MGHSLPQRTVVWRLHELSISPRPLVISVVRQKKKSGVLIYELSDVVDGVVICNVGYGYV